MYNYITQYYLFVRSQGMDFDTVHDVIATSSDNSQMVRCSGNEISKLNETKTNNL